MTTFEATETLIPNDAAIANAGFFARLWGHVFAAIYNPSFRLTERRGNAERRAQVLSAANGRVVELGAGTGHNLEHYPDGIDLLLTEPHDPMADRLERRLLGSNRTAKVVRTGAESLPFPDASADTVVSTLVLCTVDDPDATLAEAMRILKPGGQLLFIEHVAADDDRLRKWQERTQKPWHGFACGCHTNRRTERSIRGAGFQMDELAYGELEIDLPVIKPLIWGRAVKPRGV